MDKRNYKKLLFLSFILVSLYACTILDVQAEAEEQTFTTQVSYVQKDTIAYRMLVGVTGDGELRYEQNGKEYRIRNETVGILLASYDSITFTLVADEGVDVKNILLNGQPLKSRSSTYEITLYGSDRNQTLEIEFEEQEDVLIENIQNTIMQGEQIIVPNTGISMSSYMGKACFISLCICMYLYQKRRSILD